MNVEKNDDVTVTPPNTLEVYRIISTDWSFTNTSSLVPWHDNYLGIGTDVHNKRLVQEEVDNDNEEADLRSVGCGEVGAWDFNGKDNCDCCVTVH